MLNYPRIIVYFTDLRCVATISLAVRGFLVLSVMYKIVFYQTIKYLYFFFFTNIRFFSITIIRSYIRIKYAKLSTFCVVYVAFYFIFKRVYAYGIKEIIIIIAISRQRQYNITFNLIILL